MESQRRGAACLRRKRRTRGRGVDFVLLVRGGSVGRTGRTRDEGGARVGAAGHRRSVRDRRGAFGTAGGVPSAIDRGVVVVVVGGKGRKENARRREVRRALPESARSRSRPSRRSGVSRGAALTSAPDHEHLAVIHAGGPAPQAHPPVMRPRAVAPSKLRRARLEPLRRVQPRRVELVGGGARPGPKPPPRAREAASRGGSRAPGARTSALGAAHRRTCPPIPRQPESQSPRARPPIRGKCEPVESRNKPTIDRLN